MPLRSDDSPPARNEGAPPTDARDERHVVAALDTERERIGQDLHDSVGQLLTGVRLLSEGLEATPGLDDASAETARRIAALAAEALDEVRRVSWGLAAPPPAPGGVADALAELSRRVDAFGPARCVFETTGDVRVDPDAALQVYRVVQEATTNALRHADASTIRVALHRRGGRVVVEVSDDGDGNAPPAGGPGALGLAGMARRARSVGASFAVAARPGGGTVVRVSLAPGGGAAARGRDGDAGP